MTQAVSRILEETQQLSSDERAELIDLIVEQYQDEPWELDPAYMQEIERRTAEVEAGTARLFSAEEVEERIQGLLKELRSGG